MDFVIKDKTQQLILLKIIFLFNSSSTQKILDNIGIQNTKLPLLRYEYKSLIKSLKYIFFLPFQTEVNIISSKYNLPTNLNDLKQHHFPESNSTKYIKPEKTKQTKSEIKRQLEQKRIDKKK